MSHEHKETKNCLIHSKVKKSVSRDIILFVGFNFVSHNYMLMIKSKVSNKDSFRLIFIPANFPISNWILFYLSFIKKGLHKDIRKKGEVLSLFTPPQLS